MMDKGLLMFVMVMMVAACILVIYGALTEPGRKAGMAERMELTEGEVKAAAIFWAMQGGKDDVCNGVQHFPGSGCIDVGSGRCDRSGEDLEGLA